MPAVDHFNQNSLQMQQAQRTKFSFPAKLTKTFLIFFVWFSFGGWEPSFVFDDFP
jgi:hypothetical protein